MRKLSEEADVAMEQISTGVTEPDFAVGTHVEVRDRFCNAWSRGFEIAGANDPGYQVRRLSDGWVLPASFVTRELRRTR